MIENIEGALARAIHLLGGARIGQRMGPAQLLEGKDGSFLVMFKREFYRAFQDHFPGLLNRNDNPFGFAQVMSKSLLFAAESRMVDWLVFVMPDGKAYKCATGQFIIFYRKNRTDVPHLPGEVAMPLEYFERVGN